MEEEGVDGAEAEGDMERKRAEGDEDGDMVIKPEADTCATQGIDGPCSDE